jgi:hypothetical protein
MRQRFTRAYTRQVKDFLALDYAPSNDQNIDAFLFDATPYRRRIAVQPAAAAAAAHAAPAAPEAQPLAAPAAAPVAAPASSGQEIKAEVKENEGKAEAKAKAELLIAWPAAAAAADAKTGIKVVEGDKIEYSEEFNQLLRRLATPSFFDKEPYVLTHEQLQQGLVLLGPLYTADNRMYVQVRHKSDVAVDMGRDKLAHVLVFDADAFVQPTSIDATATAGVERVAMHRIHDNDVKCCWHFIKIGGDYYQALPRDGYPAVVYKTTEIPRRIFDAKMVSPSSNSQIIKYAILQVLSVAPHQGLTADELAENVFHFRQEPKGAWLESLADDLYMDESTGVVRDESVPPRYRFYRAHV